MVSRFQANATRPTSKRICAGSRKRAAKTQSELSEPAEFMRAFARAAIEAGADIVVGHGSHTPLGIEFHKGKPIFHSVGNLIFQNETVPFFPSTAYERFGLANDATPSDFLDARTGNGKKGHVAHEAYWQNIATTCHYVGGKLNEIRIHPIHQGFGRPRGQRGRPMLAGGAMAEAIIARVDALSKPYGVRVENRNGTGVVTPPYGVSSMPGEHPQGERLRLLTETGPGTQMGGLLRKFWQPVAVSNSIKAGTARPLRVMGEDLTLYRGESGRAYLVAGRCAHRLTHLHTGWVQGEEIRCMYHGWKYAGSGQCTEAPAEGLAAPSRIRITAYPVHEYCVLIFTYMGRDAPPEFDLPRKAAFELPNLLVFARIQFWPCNWFQMIENSRD